MPENFEVTPYAVSGSVDYEELLERFGAEQLTDVQIDRFPAPIHPLLRRRVFYAGRDIEAFLEAASSGQTCSIVTGRGPSGPMHIGHAFVFYFAKYLQEQADALVYIPLSDDEKYWLKDATLDEIRTHTIDNLRDLLAIEFDPILTRFIVDTTDADIVYPAATAFAKDLTTSTVEATYGEAPNVGIGFYPAVQTAHLLLPQLVHGRHPTLVPVAIDQDPHVRISRDIAGKARFPVDKPGALLSKFLPRLTGPGKMSTSGDEPAIYLTDDRETVREKIHQYAYSGGRSSVEQHRAHGGDPTVDVAYQYLYDFFEPDDDAIQRLAEEYRSGELLSGELKDYAADRIVDFLARHQRSQRALGDIEEEVSAYRLTDDERRKVLQRIGLRGDR